jgi:predicted Fe-Mo cluster-binding NifX family protein
MKIGVTAIADNLEAEIDPRFGRCRYFLIIDPETMEFEVLSNEGLGAMGGAGIATAQAIAGRGVTVLITGNVGPNAFEALKASGIEMLTGVSGTVKEAIENYKRGELQVSVVPTVGAHFGFGNGPGHGRGRGRGPGQRW